MLQGFGNPQCILFTDVYHIYLFGRLWWVSNKTTCQLKNPTNWKWASAFRLGTNLDPMANLQTHTMHLWLKHWRSNSTQTVSNKQRNNTTWNLQKLSICRPIDYDYDRLWIQLFCLVILSKSYTIDWNHHQIASTRRDLEDLIDVWIELSNVPSSNRDFFKEIQTNFSCFKTEVW